MRFLLLVTGLLFSQFSFALSDDILSAEYTTDVKIVELKNANNESFKVLLSSQRFMEPVWRDGALKILVINDNKSVVYDTIQSAVYHVDTNLSDVKVIDQGKAVVVTYTADCGSGPTGDYTEQITIKLQKATNLALYGIRGVC